MIYNDDDYGVLTGCFANSPAQFEGHDLIHDDVKYLNVTAAPPALAECIGAVDIRS